MKTIRRLLIIFFIALNFAFYFYPTSALGQANAVRVAVGVMCLLFSIPVLIKINRLYFDRISGKHTVSDNIEGLPNWMTKALAFEARIVNKLWSVLKK